MSESSLKWTPAAARSNDTATGLKLLVKIVCLITVTAPCVVALHSNYLACDRSADVRAPRLVEDLLDPLPKGSLVFTREWQFYSPWWALHHLRQYRPVSLLTLQYVYVNNCTGISLEEI